MALNAYLKMKGARTGEVKGSVTQKGREGKILVIAVSHEIGTPRDAVSGLPTGKRMHKPFVITKELDRSSPLLYDMLITNDNIPDWELQFWHPVISAAGAGAERQDYTVRLTNARIVDIQFRMPNNKNPELTRINEYEEVSFVYEKIEWIWVPDGITASDRVS